MRNSAGKRTLRHYLPFAQLEVPTSEDQARLHLRAQTPEGTAPTFPGEEVSLLRATTFMLCQHKAGPLHKAAESAGIDPEGSQGQAGPQAAGEGRSIPLLLSTSRTGVTMLAQLPMKLQF